MYVICESEIWEKIYERLKSKLANGHLLLRSEREREREKKT